MNTWLVRIGTREVASCPTEEAVRAARRLIGEGAAVFRVSNLGADLRYVQEVD